MMQLFLTLFFIIFIKDPPELSVPVDPECSTQIIDR